MNSFAADPVKTTGRHFGSMNCLLEASRRRTLSQWIRTLELQRQRLTLTVPSLGTTNESDD